MVGDVPTCAAALVEPVAGDADVVGRGRPGERDRGLTDAARRQAPSASTAASCPGRRSLLLSSFVLVPETLPAASTAATAERVGRAAGQSGEGVARARSLCPTCVPSLVEAGSR